MNRETICQDNQTVRDFCNFIEGIIDLPDKEDEIINAVENSFKNLSKKLNIGYTNINYLNLDKFDIDDLECIAEEMTSQFGESKEYNISSRETMLGTTILAVEW